MHRIDAGNQEDTTTIPGKRIFQDNLALGTKVTAHITNAIQEEMAGAIEDSGIVLRSTGALDLASLYRGQLTPAIRRLARKLPETNFNISASTGEASTVTLVPDPDIHAYNLIGDSGDCLELDQDIAHKGRFVLLINDTVNKYFKVKYGAGASPAVLVIGRESSTLMYASDNGAVCLWVPVGAQPKMVTISCKASLGGVVGPAFDLNYTHDPETRLTTIQMASPTLFGVTGGVAAPELVIVQADLSPLPMEMIPFANGMACGLGFWWDFSTPPMVSARFYGNTAGDLRFKRDSGVNFPTTVLVEMLPMTFRAFI